MFRLLFILVLSGIFSCAQHIEQPPPLSIPATPPPATLHAADIQLESVVVTAAPLRVQFAEPLFNPGAVLPRPVMLRQLTQWFDFLQQKPESFWRLEVVAAATETTDPAALATARIDILRRLLERHGLSLARFEFTRATSATSSVIFYLK
ncbi:MAG: hypothetical protein P1P74_01905 [Desulfuromonadales bacterium]|nr:hypothetical protein [Desulfuromonadales bacterium]